MYDSTLNTDMMKRTETGADRVKQRTHRNKKSSERNQFTKKKEIIEPVHIKIETLSHVCGSRSEENHSLKKNTK